MSTSTQSADLVRLTVSAGDRTMDLVLPSRLPLAEILPEVASLVGSLDANTRARRHVDRIGVLCCVVTRSERWSL